MNHEIYKVSIMVSEHVRCLQPKESSSECYNIFLKKQQNVNKVVIWLPYKILNHCNSTNC
jgi:hypothetical protein